MDKQYIVLIQMILERCFEIENFYDYFCENRKSILDKIEKLQRRFFERSFESTVAASKFEEWYIRVEKKLLREKPEKVNFKKPKNTFEIYGNGYALSTEFLRKARLQKWNYQEYARTNIEKLGYE